MTLSIAVSARLRSRARLRTRWGNAPGGMFAAAAVAEALRAHGWGFQTPEVAASVLGVARDAGLLLPQGGA